MPKTKGGLVPAQLINLSTNEIVHFMFNPNEYTISKSNSWEKKSKKGSNVPSVSFKQGGTKTLKLQIFFDTFMDETRTDVRKYTDTIWKMMAVDPNKEDSSTKKSEPPQVAFKWGNLYFKAVITQMSQKFTLFLDTGVPVRSTIDLTLEQVEDPYEFRPQPVPSQPTDTRKAIISQLKQRLDQIANDELGSPSKYRDIAAASNVDDPRKIPPGTQLTVPKD